MVSMSPCFPAVLAELAYMEQFLARSDLAEAGGYDDKAAARKAKAQKG